MVENRRRPTPQLRLVTDDTLRAEPVAVELETDRHPALRRAVAILAALLLHAAAFISLLDKLPLEKPSPPAPIPVELAFDPPKPKPPAAQQPKTAQQPQPERRSGGELEHVAPGTPPAPTTAETKPTPAAPPPQTPPPPAMPAPPDAPSEQAVPIPPPAPPRDTQQTMIAPPVPPKKPPAPATQKVPAPAPAQTQTATAPPDADLKPGQGGGDRYLNAARAKILLHLVYPPTAELFHITGMATYEIVINRKGELLDVRLAMSSRYAVLDNAGFQTIRMSAPFGPVPDDFPGDPIALILDISMGPKQ